jgi:hypothetical protein
MESKRTFKAVVLAIVAIDRHGAVHKIFQMSLKKKNTKTKIHRKPLFFNPSAMAARAFFIGLATSAANRSFSNAASPFSRKSRTASNMASISSDAWWLLKTTSANAKGF